jgi:hypothetical protein
LRLDLNPGVVIAFAAFVILLFAATRAWQKRQERRYGNRARLWVAVVWTGAGALLAAVIGMFALLAFRN